MNKTISLPDSQFEQASERAAEQHRNFSNYVRNLIARDLDGTLPTQRVENCADQDSKCAVSKSR